MVADLFGTLLQELGKALGVSLHPDKNNACKIKLKDGTVFQIELDQASEHLVIGSDLGEVPPGRYRELIFREALRANGMSHPTNGTLAYSKQADHLILFERMPVKDLTGDQVATFVPLFAAKVKLWKDAASRGEMPYIAAVAGGSSGGGLFGLKR